MGLLVSLIKVAMGILSFLVILLSLTSFFSLDDYEQARRVYGILLQASIALLALSVAVRLLGG